MAHFVVTFLALVWLFRRDPARYPRWRNTLALTTCLAVVGFAAYSLMPPRLLDDPGEFGACQLSAPEAVVGWEPGEPHPSACDRYGYVDTVARYGGWISFGNEGMKDVSNQYAAMPSLHSGWDLLVGMAIVSAATSLWLRAIGFIMPVLMAVAVVFTANHYLLDAAIAAALATAIGVLARPHHNDHAESSASPDPEPARTPLTAPGLQSAPTRRSQRQCVTDPARATRVTSPPPIRITSRTPCRDDDPVPANS